VFQILPDNTEYKFVKTAENLLVVFKLQADVERFHPRQVLKWMREYSFIEPKTKKIATEN
jgi:hypothetical protein